MYVVVMLCCCYWWWLWPRCLQISLHPSIYWFIIHPSHHSICLSIHLINHSIHQYLSLYLFIIPSINIYLSIYLSQEVEGTLDHRIEVLEDFFDNHLTRKIDNIAYALERSVTNKLQEVEGTYVSKAHTLHEDLKVGKKGQAWMIPFLILVVIMIGGAVGLYLFYEKMKKMHLL